MEGLDLCADAVFRKRILHLSGDVAVDEAQLISHEGDDNNDDDTQTDGDAGEYSVATRDEASAPAHWRWLNAVIRLAGV